MSTLGAKLNQNLVDLINSYQNNIRWKILDIRDRVITNSILHGSVAVTVEIDLMYKNLSPYHIVPDDPICNLENERVSFATLGRGPLSDVINECLISWLNENELPYFFQPIQHQPVSYDDTKLILEISVVGRLTTPPKK